MSVARTSSPPRLPPSPGFRSSPNSENEEKNDWTGVNLDEFELDIMNPPDDRVTSPLLSDPEPAAPQELVDPPGGSIRFAAVKDCPRPVNVALTAVVSSIIGGMAGGVAGVVVKRAADLAGEAADAALGGGVVSGMVLGATIYAVLEMWGEKCP